MLAVPTLNWRKNQHKSESTIFGLPKAQQTNFQMKIVTCQDGLYQMCSFSDALLCKNRRIPRRVCLKIPISIHVYIYIYIYVYHATPILSGFPFGFPSKPFAYQDRLLLGFGCGCPAPTWFKGKPKPNLGCPQIPCQKFNF